MIKKKIIRPETPMQTIGVVGVCRGIGTTHTAISIAAYCAYIKSAKTAIYEWNSHGDFARIRKTHKVKKLGLHGYRLYDIDMYEGEGLGGYLEVSACGYEYLIVDFGEIGEGNRADISRCNKNIFILSMEAWKIGAALDMICMRDMNIDNRRDWFAAFGGENDAKIIKRRYHIDVHRIPFSADAWDISSEVYSRWSTVL